MLVATDTADDAGVVRLTDDLAIVQTVDFFTPIVDDPYDFGRIAATNALSDVYAMGGVPVTRAQPRRLSARDARRRGPRARSCAAAPTRSPPRAAPIVGGHSIDDPEPKYGLAVTGTVHPDRVLTNAGGRAGDALVLTKPLGAGAVATAIKRGLADDDVVARAIEVMTTLNAAAPSGARGAGAHALTDVTGFGLLGHLHELAEASGVAAEVDAAAVPAIDGVLELLAGERGARGRLAAQPRVRRGLHELRRRTCPSRAGGCSATR